MKILNWKKSRGGGGTSL